MLSVCVQMLIAPGSTNSLALIFYENICRAGEKNIQVNSPSIVSNHTTAGLPGFWYHLSAKLIVIPKVRWPLVCTKSSSEGAFQNPPQSRVLEQWESPVNILLITSFETPKLFTACHFVLILVLFSNQMIRTNIQAVILQQILQNLIVYLDLQ